MRAIELSGDGLENLICLPGQDVALSFRTADGTKVRRRYSIRSFRPEKRILEINVIMHGDGPGVRWVTSAKEGMEIEGVAPRGKITLAPDVDWHLFAGDATAIPGSFSILEALSSAVPALTFFLVDSPEEQVPFKGDGTAGRINWEYGEAANDGGRLIDAMRRAPLPSGAGHAYLAGEVGLVRSLKDALTNSGWSLERISAKAYWNRGLANAGHGEPEQKVS
jgi:NADPH-dependent ferric siderophore reductase